MCRSLVECGTVRTDCALERGDPPPLLGDQTPTTTVLLQFCWRSSLGSLERTRDVEISVVWAMAQEPSIFRVALNDQNAMAKPWSPLDGDDDDQKSINESDRTVYTPLQSMKDVQGMCGYFPTDPSLSTIERATTLTATEYRFITLVVWGNRYRCQIRNAPFSNTMFLVLILHK